MLSTPFTTYARIRIPKLLLYFVWGIIILMVCIKVRIDGYQAIVQMSKEQPKWVKRNADVLAQLLQSGACFSIYCSQAYLIEWIYVTVFCNDLCPINPRLISRCFPFV